MISLLKSRFVKFVMSTAQGGPLPAKKSLYGIRIIFLTRRGFAHTSEHRSS